MKQLTRRFVNWMEHGPAYLTIWFVPALLLIGLIAAIINFRKDHRA